MVGHGKYLTNAWNYRTCLLFQNCPHLSFFNGRLIHNQPFLKLYLFRPGYTEVDQQKFKIFPCIQNYGINIFFSDLEHKNHWFKTCVLTLTSRLIDKLYLIIKFLLKHFFMFKIQFSLKAINAFTKGCLNNFICITTLAPSIGKK